MWLAFARRDFAGHQLIVGHVCGFYLVAERDNGAEGIALWNLKQLAGGVVVVASHLVCDEAQSGGLQREVGTGSPQVVESIRVRGAAAAALCVGGSQD